MERKKKNFGRRSSRKTSSAHSEERAPTETSRAPSDIEKIDLHTQQCFTTTQKRKFDDLLHPEESIDQSSEPPENSPSSVFLGDIKKIGSIHLSVQQQVDSPSTNETDPKSKKRRQRAAIKERLRPAAAEKNLDPQKYRSRVFRTADVHCPEKKHIDFDMGMSLLSSEMDGSKRFLLFRSLEVTLRDQDINSEPDDTTLGMESSSEKAPEIVKLVDI